jgi:hypothetical protein
VSDTAFWWHGQAVMLIKMKNYCPADLHQQHNIREGRGFGLPGVSGFLCM